MQQFADKLPFRNDAFTLPRNGEDVAFEPLTIDGQLNVFRLSEPELGLELLSINSAAAIEVPGNQRTPLGQGTPEPEESVALFAFTKPPNGVPVMLPLAN